MRGFHGMMADIKLGYTISEKQLIHLKREFDLSSVPIKEIDGPSEKRYLLELPSKKAL